MTGLAMDQLPVQGVFRCCREAPKAVMRTNSTNGGFVRIVLKKSLFDRRPALGRRCSGVRFTLGWELTWLICGGFEPLQPLGTHLLLRLVL